MLLTAGERISMSRWRWPSTPWDSRPASYTGSQAGVITTWRARQRGIIDVTPGRIQTRLADGAIAIVRRLQGVSQGSDHAGLRARVRAGLESQGVDGHRTSDMEIRSPAVSSMSSSRAGGTGATCEARSSSSSVESPIADTATTTSLPPCGWRRRAPHAFDPLGTFQ